MDAQFPSSFVDRGDRGWDERQPKDEGGLSHDKSDETWGAVSDLINLQTVHDMAPCRSFKGSQTWNFINLIFFRFPSSLRSYVKVWGFCLGDASGHPFPWLANNQRWNPKPSSRPSSFGISILQISDNGDGFICFPFRYKTYRVQQDSIQETHFGWCKDVIPWFQGVDKLNHRNHSLLVGKTLSKGWWIGSESPQNARNIQVKELIIICLEICLGRGNLALQMILNRRLNSWGAEMALFQDFPSWWIIVICSGKYVIWCHQVSWISSLRWNRWHAQGIRWASAPSVGHFGHVFLGEVWSVKRVCDECPFFLGGVLNITFRGLLWL